MIAVKTADLDFTNLTSDESLWVYCGIDSCIPQEVLPILLKQLDENTSRIYKFERAQQKVALAMMLRGVRLNPRLVSDLVLSLEKQSAKLNEYINRLAHVVWQKDLNPRSPEQLKAFFYGALAIPPIYVKVKGERKISTGREALEKMLGYYLAQPVIKAILALRDTEKKISVFQRRAKRGASVVTEMKVADNWRFYASFHPASTETGRWSSTKNVFGYGSNLQNITDELRHVFIPDEGMMFMYADLEQAESHGVAFRSGDENYIAALGSGDLHTYVARLIWPDVAWTGDMSKDKKLASAPYYRHFSRRDLAKRAGHALNYRASPWTIAQHLKVERKISEEFAARYMAQFPRIEAWHRDVARRIQIDGYIVTMMGRRIMFFDRPRDDNTIREAIASDPQSTVADILDLGAYRMWKHLDKRCEFELLIQVHDATLSQFRVRSPVETVELAAKVAELLQIEVPVGGRVMRIPVEVMIGYSWAKDSLVKPTDLYKVRLEAPNTNIFDAIIG